MNGTISVIAGGQNNTVNANQSAIVGGSGNVIQTGSYYSLIGSGGGNLIQTNSYDSVIGGGYHNTVLSNSVVSVINGGQFNTIGSNVNFAVIGGGLGNTNSGNSAVIGGGSGNGAGGRGATVGGGAGNFAGGNYGTIPGGSSNQASGLYSFAAGQQAQATNQGAFVWADSQNAPYTSTNNDSFSVRAQGGVSLVTSGAGLQVDGAQVMTTAIGSIPSSLINDGGAAAYSTFQQTEQSIGGDTTVGFSGLSGVTATNGSSPSFSLTVNGSAFGSVIGFSGCEALSHPYSFVVEVTNTSSLSPPNTHIGQAAVLTYSRNGRTTTFSGTVLVCAQASTAPASYLYTVQFAPALSRLGYTSDYQIFQNESVPTIATSVYNGDAGSSPAENFSSSYAARTTLTQYGETDLNFFNRILESEGIYYYFDLSVTPPTLTLADSSAAYQTGANSAFNFYGNNATNFGPGEEYVRTFQLTSHEVTQQSSVNSYDFQSASADLLKTADAVPPDIGGTFDYGNSVQTATYDSALAGYARDGQSMAQLAIAGTANAPDLRPGYKFTLTDQSGAGLGGTYLVTSVHHAGFVRVVNGVSTWFYGDQFQVIPASLNYRPPMVTPKPKAVADTAKVTGQSGQEVDVDAYGEVKVLFHWDRHYTGTGNSSAFVRVTTPWAGPGYGAYFWPRIGNEVMISYVDGDPDQPIITGGLFNSDNTVPYSLPGNKNVSGIKTLSTVGGGGFNELRFTDTKGSEEVYLQAQKDWNIKVLHDFDMTVGNNMTINDAGNLLLEAAAITLNSPGVTMTGDLTLAGTCFGDGSGLTNLNASALVSGIISPNVLPGFQGLQNAIGGGSGNTVNGTISVIAGGQNNTVNANQSAIVGGSGNVIQTGSYYSLIGSGGGNLIQTNSYDSVIGGGYHNTVLSNSVVSVINGGQFNTIGANVNFAVIGGGYGNTNGGVFSTIPGGYQNLTTGLYSFAAGANAQATNNASFVWADGSAVTGSFTNNSVAMRATNGFRFYAGISGATYAYLAPGSGSWTSMSDRNAKEHFTPVDPEAVLARVSVLPLTTWNYKTQPESVRHIGPTAQDFKAAFAVGESETGISVVDEGGVALAAIQGLNQKMESDNAALRAENSDLKARLEKLETMVTALSDRNK